MLFVKYLIKKRSYAAGRNSGGRITCRHRGGSLTKRFVLPNLRRRIYDCLGEVLLIKRESVRSAFLALIYYRRFGIYEYMLCPHKIRRVVMLFRLIKLLMSMIVCGLISMQNIFLI